MNTKSEDDKWQWAKLFDLNSHSHSNIFNPSIKRIGGTAFVETEATQSTMLDLNEFLDSLAPEEEDLNLQDKDYQKDKNKLN